jgi:hypothetical protein
MWGNLNIYYLLRNKQLQKLQSIATCKNKSVIHSFQRSLNNFTNSSTYQKPMRISERQQKYAMGLQGKDSSQKQKNPASENVGSSQFKSPAMSPIKQLNLSRASCIQIDASKFANESSQKERISS